MNTESEVLQVLCDHEVSIMDRGYPLSSTYISQRLDITLYRTRKALKSLKEKGLIKSYRCGIYDDMSETTILASGYRLTNLAKETKEYQCATERAIKICQDVFNIDVSSALKGE